MEGLFIFALCVILTVPVKVQKYNNVWPVEFEVGLELAHTYRDIDNSVVAPVGFMKTKFNHTAMPFNVDFQFATSYFRCNSHNLHMTHILNIERVEHIFGHSITNT